MATIDVWFEAILRFSLLAFLLLGACTVILRFIPQPLERIRSIQIALCCVFFAGLLSLPGWKPAIELPLLPPAELPGPVEHNGAQPGPPSAFSAQVPVETGADPGLNHLVSHSTGGVARDSASAGAALFPARPVDWRGLVKRATVIGFLGISLLQIVYLLFGYAATRRLIASSTPLAKSAEMRVRDAFSPLSARGDIRLRTSANIHVPLVSGVIHPTILLPSDLVADDVAGLPLRHSLAHEWQHILRNDLMTWQLVTLCQVFLWPQPFYWVLRRELRVSQDQIADGFVAEQTGQQVAYAETLVRFARSRQLPALGALSIAGSRSNLLRRVEMLLNDKFCVSASARKPVVFGVATAMLAAVTVLASLQLTRATVRGMEPAEESKPARGEGHKNQNGESIEPVQHSGLVLDAKTQKPIAGATVIVTRMKSDDWRELAVTESTTDADGKYTFTIPPDQLKQQMLYIMFDLRHSEYAPRHCGSYSYAMIQKNLVLGSQPWFTELKMVPASKISGRLVDKAGKPVAGAQLRGNSNDPTAGSSSAGDLTGSSWVEGVSDEEGKFEVQVTREGTAGLSIVPLSHCMKHIDFISKRGDVGDIVLSEGLSIRGRVVDARGNPMQGLWVNLTREDDESTASYEMKRSSKTDERGEFRTRPLSPGKYSVEVEMKATGAIEKAKYANFHHDPPPAMFVKQVVEVSGDEPGKPFVIQAVPHVLISGQCYDSSGKKRAFHSPYLMGQFNDQHIWIREGRGVEGAFELMVPHGVKNADLRFTTNEHSALTVQLAGGEAMPQRHWHFDSIEQDIGGIRIVRYVAPILQVNVVDQSGTEIPGARVMATYAVERKVTGPRTGMISYFERQSSGLYQSSSLAPGFEFEVFASKDSLESERTTLTMQEGQNQVITLTLKKKTAEPNPEKKEE